MKLVCCVTSCFVVFEKMKRSLHRYWRSKWSSFCFQSHPPIFLRVCERSDCCPIIDIIIDEKLTWTFPGSQIVALGREPELNDVCPFDFATLCQLCSVENLDTIRRRHQEPGSNSILFAIDPTSRWLRKRRHVRTCCTGRFWSWSRV